MPKSSYASVVLDMDTEAEPQAHPLEPRSDHPFRILVLGDFSGRTNRGEPPPSRLRPYLIDRDIFDEVLARMRPELELGPHGRGMVLRFRELDDFHPDNIYRQDVFEKFRAVRHLLATQAPPATAAAPAPAPPQAPDLPALTGGSLLDSILETTEAQPPRQPDALREFIERAVAPHTAPREDARLAARNAEVSAEAGKVMRALLHHSDFQALEAAWRALDWLVRGLETGPHLKVYALDISKADVPGSLRELRRILVDEAAGTPGGEPWALVAANFTFSRNASDIRLLTGLAGIVRAAGAALVAEADPDDADAPAAERLWQALRGSPEASSIGLALPRFLLRLPYGEKTSTIESFAFEEMPGTPDHHEYLWGNPAFACAYLLGRAFSRDGWDLRPGTQTLISGLPLHVYESDGEQQLKPCAEVLMTEAEADWVLERGCMPLVSIKNQDAVRLLRFQSIAQPPAPLSGPWT
ncbi:MAG TPA: type VI secretion system contractile sheath large subunit [Bryobacteraceae bacterium]|jgi:type VI secretion system protein ImpC|nr:type VI secretion system contractile sheath large subunit [Bryobacteraceae bacterium]